MLLKDVGVESSAKILTRSNTREPYSTALNRETIHGEPICSWCCITLLMG